MQNVTLSVSDEVMALGTALGGLITDIKGGKSALQDVEDAFANLVGALGALEKIATDIKSQDNQAYLVRCLLLAVEPVAAST